MAEQHRRLAEEIERLIEWVGALESRLDRQRLEAAWIRPGQLPDTLLHENGIKFIKGSGMATLFASITKVQRMGNKLLVEATGSVPAALRGAFRKAVDLVLGQMHNPDATPAGRLLAATVDTGGTLMIKALVDDRPAQLKAEAKVYPGISIRLNGDEIDEVALVDRDFSKLSKGAGATDTVLAKIYDRKEIAVTPLENVLRKFADPSTGKGVRLTPDERATLLAVPAVAAEIERLSHIEVGSGDWRKRAQSESDALFLIKAAQQQPMTGARFSVR